MKKLEHFLVITILTISCACLHTGCTYDEFLSATKPCGVSAHWDFDFETGALTITGEGAIEGTPYAENMKSAITSLTLSEGITSIGDTVFRGCENIKSVFWNARNCNRTIFRNNRPIYDAYGNQEKDEYGNLAFEEIDPIESFVFGDQVKIIPTRICHDMHKLTEIIIPNSVTHIEFRAFSQCYNLKSVTIGNNVKSIGPRAFQNCHALTNITIPNSVTELGDTVFSDCSSLTDVTLGNGIRTIGNRVFCNCHSLQNITLPDNVYRIGKSAFQECSSLTSINLQKHINIGDYAFRRSGLTNVSIPEYATIGKRAFENCWKLKTVTINGYVSGLNRNTFSDCNNISSFIFGESVSTNIQDSLCFEMDALKKVIISGQINYIGNYAFANCDSLNTVICMATYAPYLMDSVFMQRNSRKIENLYVPANLVDNYKNWYKYFVNILPIEEYSGEIYW